MFQLQRIKYSYTQKFQNTNVHFSKKTFSNIIKMKHHYHIETIIKYENVF